MASDLDQKAKMSRARNKFARSAIQVSDNFSQSFKLDRRDQDCPVTKLIDSLGRQAEWASCCRRLYKKKHRILIASEIICHFFERVSNMLKGAYHQDAMSEVESSVVAILDK